MTDKKNSTPMEQPPADTTLFNLATELDCATFEQKRLDNLLCLLIEHLEAESYCKTENIASAGANLICRMGLFTALADSARDVVEKVQQRLIKTTEQLYEIGRANRGKAADI